MREYFEIASFVASIVMACAAIYALRQIKTGLGQLKANVDQNEISRMDIQLRSKREAALLGVQVCEKWAKEIVPSTADLVNAIDRKFAPGIPVKFLKSEIGPDQKHWLEWTEQENHHSAIIRLLNNIESVAVYFEQKLADEDLAFGPLANGFVSNVRLFWPWIAYHRPFDDHKLYPNTVALFFRWEARLNEVGLMIASEKIQNQIKALPTTKAHPPIGTNLNK